MTNGRLIALSFIALVLEGAEVQAAEQSQPLSEQQQSREDESFRGLFNDWRAISRVSGDDSTVDGLPSCYNVRDMNSPPDAPNWATLLAGNGAASEVSSYIETKSIKNCSSSDEKSVLFWEKHLFGDGTYILYRFKFQCQTRRGGYSDRSWLYLKNGKVVEVQGLDGIDNPLPISSAFKLMKYICDDDRNTTIDHIPEVRLEWLDVEYTSGDIGFSILGNDIAYEKYDELYPVIEPLGSSNSRDMPDVKFWVRRDYSKAEWTKYRYTYSRDTIDCQKLTYKAGRAYAFLPNKNFDGVEVSIDTMYNIAPKSAEEAIMRKVCAF